jgi:formylglycine-generating enzyme required for sulfatase activity
MMMSPISKAAIAILATAAACWLAACDECATSRDCDTGQVCIDGTCERPEPFNPSTDSDSDIDTDSDTDSDSDADPKEIDWVEIPGGSYMMGYADGQENELPVHQVEVPGFEISRSEITVIQFSVCVAAGTCEEPETGARFNWEEPGHAGHPINGVGWLDAVNFCAFVEARLPSEAEWEFAARSGGQDLKYPWGEEDPTCELCIMNEENETMGCGEGHTWQVCSKPLGFTEQGLCDMSGNVYEWMQDYFYDTYAGAPADGSAWETPPYPDYTDRTIRSASYREPAGNSMLRTSGRLRYEESGSQPDLGFRCARDLASN